MTRLMRTFAAASLITASMSVAAGIAHADDDVAVNGVFDAVSDGKWAKTNESFRDEATVTRRWTISSSCATYQDCTGTVASDDGWTANLVFKSGQWRTVRTIDKWEPCAGGPAVSGEQSFIFWPARADAPDRHDHLVGWDQTVGPTGACGVNRSLNVRLPLTLTRVS